MQTLACEQKTYMPGYAGHLRGVRAEALFGKSTYAHVSEASCFEPEKSVIQRGAAAKRRSEVIAKPFSLPCIGEPKVGYTGVFEQGYRARSRGVSVDTDAAALKRDLSLPGIPRAHAAPDDHIPIINGRGPQRDKDTTTGHDFSPPSKNRRRSDRRARRSKLPTA